VRPGGVLAVLAGLAAVIAALRLPAFGALSLPLGNVVIPLSLPPLNAAYVQAILLFGLYMIVLAWWLPSDGHAVQWTLCALAGLVLPLFVADELLAVCALLLSAAALAPVLVQGKDDRPALLFVGMAVSGVACVVIGLLVVRSPAAMPLGENLRLARLLIVAGFAMLLGVAPAPLWLPGVVEQTHTLGAALAAGIFPIVTILVALQTAASDMPYSNWLTGGLDGEGLVVAGSFTVVLAAALALVQSNLRRLVGLLLVADLGFVVVAVGLGLVYDASLYPIVLLLLAGRALGVAVLLPALTFVTAGFRCALRPALVLMLACGAWMSMGGPLTLAFSLHLEVLQLVAQEGGALAWGLIGGAVLLVLGWVVLLVRAWQLPVAETVRPCPRLALLLMAAVVVLSLLLQL
jgi:formate hydrogenlyase subunit 3/multisubunit Na+/H+ antiporter MnhD subunit